MTGRESLGTHAHRLAAAIRKAADEHGRPNSFSCAELETYGGPSRLLSGRIGSTNYINVVHVRLGGAAWGTCPMYQGGRFHV